MRKVDDYKEIQRAYSVFKPNIHSTIRNKQSITCFFGYLGFPIQATNYYLR